MNVTNLPVPEKSRRKVLPPFIYSSHSFSLHPPHCCHLGTSQSLLAIWNRLWPLVHHQSSLQMQLFAIILGFQCPNSMMALIRMTSSTSPFQLPTWYDYLLDPKITQGSLPRPLAPWLSICCSYTSQRSPLPCHIFSQPVGPLWIPFLHTHTTFLYWSCKLLSHHYPQFICIPIIPPLTIRQNSHLEQYSNSSLLLLC